MRRNIRSLWSWRRTHQATHCRYRSCWTRTVEAAAQLVAWEFEAVNSSNLRSHRQAMWPTAPTDRRHLLTSLWHISCTVARVWWDKKLFASFLCTSLHRPLRRGLFFRCIELAQRQHHARSLIREIQHYTFRHFLIVYTNTCVRANHSFTCVSCYFNFHSHSDAECSLLQKCSCGLCYMECNSPLRRWRHPGPSAELSHLAEADWNNPRVSPCYCLP